MATVRHLGLFPFCIAAYPPKDESGTELQIGDGTPYPIIVSKQDAAAIWWRVKKWRMSFTYSEYIDFSLQGQYTGSYQEILPTSSSFVSNSNTLFGPKTLITAENELVCLKGYEEASFGDSGWNTTYQVNGQITYEPAPPNPAPPPTPIDFERTDGSGFSIGIVNQIFGPLFSKTANSQSDQLAVLLDVTVGPFNTRRVEQAATATFSINGNSYPFQIGVQFDESSGESYTLQNLILEPYEWWAYDPNDGGGPIYDTTTGQQLRPSPLN